MSTTSSPTSARTTPAAAADPATPLWLLLCAGAVLGMAMGTRHVQGLFMLPMLADKGWGREAFALAAGLQTLVWGIAQPFTGWLADRHGTAPVIAGGCLLYGVGLVLEAFAPSTGMLALGTGGVIGLALSATTFSTVYGGLARIIAPERRGAAQGVAGAIAGVAQFLLVPGAQAAINAWGWSQALLVLAGVAALCAIGGWRVNDRARQTTGSAAGTPGTSSASTAAQPVTAPPSAAPTVRAALGHSGFWLLNLGFVACGFQLAFLGTHLPAYLRDGGMGTAAGVNAIALIALANAAGIYVCGKLGDLYRRKYLLAGLYGVRTLAMVAFTALPLNTASLYLFAVIMGATWLGTVPLTSGVVAQIFGVRYLGTLFGLVFLGHQLGGFFGAWLGGAVYDATHSYALMWAISIALGLLSVLLNLPIRDASVEQRLQAVPA